MLRAARREFADALRAALAAEGLPDDTVALEEPPEDVDAIVASSVAFRLADAAGAPPPAVAQRVADAIDLSGSRYLDAIDPVGPYLNARPSTAYHVDTVETARAGDLGRLEPRGERVVVEHTSANPTGPIHLGRARNPIIGDALVRVLDAAGYDVEAHYYVNDAGRQMAVFTWAYETFEEDDLEEAPERDRVEYDLVRYYRKGSAYLESADDEAAAAAEAEIEAIMRGLEAGDPGAYDRVAAVVDQVLAGMTACLERLPATFDRFVRETAFMRDGSTDEVIERLQGLPEAEREDGAWQLDLRAYEIDKPFVFLRSDGTSLYTTRDLAHHEWKFEGYDRAITVLGEDQELHVRQLRAALDLLGHDVDRLEEVLYGYVNLPGGRSMSTRRGTGVDLDDLLDEAIARARAEVEARLDDHDRAARSEAELEAIARDVGIGAVRFDIVSTQPSKAITFDWDRALDVEAQSAPYLQYVHARCCGILERAGETPGGPVEAPVHPSAVALVETIARYPHVIEAAADRRAPHRVATHLLDLAEAFNAFYRDCPVLDAEGPTRATRLAVVEASRRTVADGLDLLGIAAPESM
ncbi:MAG: arginine--tRNA ligase [Halobacteriota archaeon]